MSFGLKVPTALRDGKAQTYITTNFLFLDTRSQKQFWLSAMLFDLREEHTFPDTAHFDGWKGGTQMLILYSALNRKSEWMHPGADSALFASQPFADHQRFDIRVTADELQKAIHVIRAKFPATDAISDHAADCHLIHFNLNPRFLPPNAAMAAWDSHCGI